MVGFASQGVFAETEMTGWLRIMDSYSTDPGPHPYIITFHPDQETTYTLNPNTMSSGVLDWAGKQVRVTVDDNVPLASSFDAETQFLDITSIGPVDTPLASSPMQIPATVRSVTLLSDFTDSGPTPTEDANKGPGQFVDPKGVAVDGSGNILVVEQGLISNEANRVQKFDASGNFLFKIDQFGSGDGQLKFPSGIAADSFGNIYVADNNNHRIQKFDPNGVYLAKAGANGGDGTSGTAGGEFNLPFGIAVDGSDNVYVADYFNHRIQVLDSSLNFIKTFGWDVTIGGGTGFEVCSTAVSCKAGAVVGNNGALPGPRGIAVDGSGNVYVSDEGTSRIQKFSSAPAFLTKVGSSGSAAGEFIQPRGVAVDGSGNVYVADRDNHRIQKFSAALGFVSMWGWDVTTGGGTGFEVCSIAVSCKAGVSGTGAGQLNAPEGIADGSVFVADTANNRVKIFNDDGTIPGGFNEMGYDGSLPHDDAYYQGIFYDNPGSLKNFYAASSWGKFNWSGEVSDWTALSNPNASYLPHSNANFDRLVEDALAAHEGNLDFCNPSPVTNLVLIFNGQVASGTPPVNTAFGSLGTWNNVPEGKIPWDIDGCSITISVSWEPDNGGFFCCGQTLDRGIGVTGHEVGHNLGLEHTPPQEGAWTAAGPFNDPYHDPNSIMSNNRDREGPSALVMGQRDQVGWVIAGNKVTVADGATATVTLDFINEAEGGANPQMAIIPLSDGTAYIVEAHQDEIHNDTPQDRKGAIMYRQFITCTGLHTPNPCGNMYSYLTFDARDQDAKYSLVATAGTALETDFDEAMLEDGESYTDVTNSVTVETLSIGATSVTVSISNNAASCSPQSGQHWVITVSCSLTGNVTADKNITVQNNAVLTIPNGMIVFFDPSTYSITVVDGSGILVQGSIKTTP